MFRTFKVAVTLGLAAAVMAAPAGAQMQQPAPRPDADTYAAPKAYEVEGKVSKVDPAAGTVAVSSGLFGLFGRTLAVTPETDIQVEGRQATLMEIKEGTKVKAAYEARDGKNVARRIEAVPPGAEKAERTSAGKPDRVKPEEPLPKTQ
jgi:Cu/Ag efflux protein CusF